MSDEGERASWLEPLPEEYTSQDDMTGRRMMVAALTVIILAVFGGLIWYSYLDGTDGPVPVVRADKSVVKEKPDTPGGLQVPDQDKSVFNRVDSEQSADSGQENNNEKLAQGAELPVELPVEIMKKDDTPTVLPQKSENVTSEYKTTTPAVEVKIDIFLVQLGAFGKKETAELLWGKLQKDNSTLLKGLNSDIMMIDLGKKGVLYRLRGGTVTDRPSAAKICDALIAKKQACIVVTE